MTIKEIAYKLMALREGMSAFIMSGQLREALGFDGYSEALARRWITPDQEGSGMLQITNDLGKVSEMRQFSEAYLSEEACTFCHKSDDECKCQKCPTCKKSNCKCESVRECKAKCGKCGKAQCNCPGRCDACKGEKCTCESLSENGRIMPWTTITQGNETFHYDDTGRKLKGPAPSKKPSEPAPVKPSGETEYFTRKDWQVKKPVSQREDALLAQRHAMRDRPNLSEIATMGLGNPDRLGTQKSGLAPGQPVAPTSQPVTSTPARQEPVSVGSNVRVVQDGKTYVGRVSAVKSDGKFTISFGGAEKPAMVRDYDKTEITPVTDDTKQ